MVEFFGTVRALDACARALGAEGRGWESGGGGGCQQQSQVNSFDPPQGGHGETSFKGPSC